MNTAIDTRSFRTDRRQDGALNALRCGGVFESSPEFPDLVYGFLRPFIFANNAVMAVAYMFFRRNPFKVIGAVIGFVMVLVMDKLGVVGVVNPTESDDSVHESHPAERPVSIAAPCGRVWSQISKNFPATRNGVEVVEESIFDSVYFNANHVGPRWVSGGMGILL